MGETDVNHGIFVHSTHTPLLFFFFLTALLPGVQVHLSTALQTVRYEGLAVAEVLTLWIADSTKPLDFHIPAEQAEATVIRNLAKRPIPVFEPTFPKPSQEEEMQIGASPPDASIKITTGFAGCHSASTSNPAPSPRNVTTTDNDIDSDDEPEALQPYAMPGNLTTSATKPKFIRDCLDGIQQKNDFERYNICLHELPHLIRQQPGELSEVGWMMIAAYSPVIFISFPY